MPCILYCEATSAGPCRFNFPVIICARDVSVHQAVYGNERGLEMYQLNTLSPEDYLEPECPLCMEPAHQDYSVVPVPQQRIKDKLDHFMNTKDYEGAERHLHYWLDEAERGHDLRGRLLVCNELIGVYRKIGKKEESFRFCAEALALLKEMDYEESISAGTTFVNAATAYSAFGEHEDALALFLKARNLYERIPHTPPHLLGGLYNNMALTYQALGRYEEAFQFYHQALEKMSLVSGGVLEQAVTCLNMADAVAEQSGLEEGEEEIGRLLDRAYTLLMDPSAAHDGYYAFICERCAPCFSYYGYFAAADELLQEAKSIHERA